MKILDKIKKKINKLFPIIATLVLFLVGLFNVFQPVLIGAETNETIIRNGVAIRIENNNYLIDWELDISGYSPYLDKFILEGNELMSKNIDRTTDVAIISPVKLKSESKAWIWKDVEEGVKVEKSYFCDSNNYGWTDFDNKILYCNITAYDNKTSSYKDIYTTIQISDDYDFIINPDNATVIWNDTVVSASIKKTDVTSKFKYKEHNTKYGNHVYYIKDVTFKANKPYRFRFEIDINKTELPVKYTVCFGDINTSTLYFCLDPTITNSRTWTVNDDFTNGTVYSNILFDDAIKMGTFSDLFQRASSKLDDIDAGNESLITWTDDPPVDSYSYTRSDKVYLDNYKMWIDKPDIGGTASDSTSVVGNFTNTSKGNITLVNLKISQTAGTSNRWMGYVIIGENLYNRSTESSVQWRINSPDATHNSLPLAMVLYDYNYIKYLCPGGSSDTYSWDFKGIVHNITIAWDTATDTVSFYKDGALLGSHSDCDNTNTVNSFGVSLFGNQCYISGDGDCTLQAEYNDFVFPRFSGGLYEDLQGWTAETGAFTNISLEVSTTDKGNVSFAWSNDNSTFTWLSLIHI